MAKRKRRKSKKERQSPVIQWQFEPEVPVYDVFKPPFDYEIAFDELIYNLKSEYYLLWEVIISQEQNLPLTKAHKKALSNLLYFGDEEEDRTLYIDEIPRPKEPWYEIARKIISKVVVEPFETEEGPSPVIFEGWEILVETLEEHGQYLSLPEGVQKPIEIFPKNLRHLIQLHLCFDALSGLGQDAELTLANPEQREYRMKWFLKCIRKSKNTLQYFELSLETLLRRIIMPPKDEVIFIRLMTEELNLPSLQAKLVDYL